MTNIYVVPTLALLIASGACAPHSPATPEAPRPSAPVQPTRFGADCDSVIWRATMTADSAQATRPSPKNAMLPPHPVPDYLRGRPLVVRFRVDEAGKPDLRASIIRGPIRSPYLERFTTALALWTFWPAVLDGCAVPGSTEISIISK
jgi:hypothetical protein